MSDPIDKNKGGNIYPEIDTTSQPSPEWIDTNFIEIAGTMIQKSKSLSCSAIILLSHLGLAYDGIVALYVPGIDFIWHPVTENSFGTKRLVIKR